MSWVDAVFCFSMLLLAIAVTASGWVEIKRKRRERRYQKAFESLFDFDGKEGRFGGLEEE